MSHDHAHHDHAPAPMMNLSTSTEMPSMMSHDHHDHSMHSGSPGDASSMHHMMEMAVSYMFEIGKIWVKKNSIQSIQFPFQVRKIDSISFHYVLVPRWMQRNDFVLTMDDKLVRWTLRLDGCHLHHGSVIRRIEILSWKSFLEVIQRTTVSSCLGTDWKEWKCWVWQHTSGSVSFKVLWCHLQSWLFYIQHLWFFFRPVFLLVSIHQFTQHNLLKTL